MSAVEYGSSAYWDERYTKQKDTTFDWIDTFPQIRPIFEEHVIEPIFQRYLADESKREKDRHAEGTMTQESKQVVAAAQQ